MKLSNFLFCFTSWILQIEATLNAGCKNTMLGLEYTGSLSKATSNRPCKSWASLRPGSHNYAELDSADNYCRNPNSSPDGPWCFITSNSWEYCDVPFCDGTTATNIDELISTQDSTTLTSHSTTFQETSISDTSSVAQDASAITTIRGDFSTATTDQSSTLTQASAETSTSNSCVCHCNRNTDSSNGKVYSEKEMSKMIKSIKDNLLIDKAKTSKYLAGRRCARDDRLSSAAIGSCGVMIIVTVILVFVMNDCVNFWMHVKVKWRKVGRKIWRQKSN